MNGQRREALRAPPAARAALVVRAGSPVSLALGALGALGAAIAVSALLTLSACGDKPAPPAVPPALLRLWREGLAGAQIAPAPPTSASEQVLLDLAAEDGQAWFRVSHPTRSERIPMVALRLQPGDTLPAGALAVVRGLSCRPGEALSLRVKSRAIDGSPGEPLTVGAVIELRRPFDAAAGLGVDEVAKLVDPHSSATHLLSGPWTPEHLDLRTDFVVDRMTVQLALVLLMPPAADSKGLAIDALQLVARPLAEQMRAGADFPRLTRLGSQGAVRIALDGDWREGLLALPGSAYAFRLPADTRERRLDLSLGVAPRDAALEGSLRLRVEAGGQTLLDETLHAPSRPEQPAWRDTSVALPAGTTTLVLSAEGAGADPPLAVFGQPSVRARSGDARPNVILISLDTLRPDRLGCYDSHGHVSPRLDALAGQALRFTQAFSTASWTLPSHGSMLTGQFPALHGAVDPQKHLDPSRSPFLARLLADAGYATAGFTGGGYVSPAYGFAEGFDRYSENDPVWALDTLRGRMLLETRAKLTGEPAASQLALLRRYAAPMVDSWIERQQDGVPYFLFLHTYIAHNYAPDRQRLEQFGLLDEEGREQPFNHQDRERFNHGGPFPEGEAELKASIYAHYMPYYDATIAMADEFVGGVLDALERSGQASNTLVVVTSDHGEEFGEHAFFGHGLSLYEPAVHVPLIVRLPERLAARPGGARRQPAVLDDPISEVDLAPWILRLVGLPPDARMSAPAPFGTTAVDPPARRLLLMELDTKDNRLSALRDGALELIHLAEGKAVGLLPGQSLLFDVLQDPAESHDLGGESQPARQRAALLDTFHEHVAQVLAGQVPVDYPIDADLEGRLRGLGYEGFGGAPAPHDESPGADPPSPPPESPPEER